ncbi:MAG: glutamine--fructose-6-phosphate transaminase (isomerizing) [Thermonemataceae bacterium]|nr:glutamine--fructose-6-phosphate transaminase (isomerizing) [Thermonemataceae bacterium]
MCGIVAYVGHRQAYEVILNGLKRLEYRGYDSAGIALLNGDLNIYKKKGKVDELKSLLEDIAQNHHLDSHIGIGHTRWATHGEPNDTNAHPHYSSNQNMAIIHNGIIENYASLKQDLSQKGHTFVSDTDSEVLVHLIEHIKDYEKCSLEEAVRLAMTQVVGAYAIVVISKEDNTQLVAARKGSPLVVGVGENEYFLASDATPIIEYTKKVVYLNDQEIVVIRNNQLQILTIDSMPITPYVQELDMELAQIEKGGFAHFMLKEIFEQPKSLRDSMRGRINADKNHLIMSGLMEYEKKILNANRLVIVGCGTSWHAGLVAEYLFEEFARIPVEVEYGSEFRYRNPIINENDIVIAISQSGETADTLAAIELAKNKGAVIFGVCNVVGASIPRATHAGAYIHAGPEIGVASTKAFTGQVMVLAMMALYLGRAKGTVSERKFQEMLAELDTIPDKVERILKNTDQQIRYIAEEFKESLNFLYLGRGYNFPVALEGALKLKEISYIHAEGYPAAEMKHGPIALIDKQMPVVFIAPKDSTYEKIVSNVQEIKARGGRIIAVVNEGDEEIKHLAEFSIEIPYTNEEFSPILTVIPLQLLAYHIAVSLGKDVDQPRNLAKSVTVE